MILGNKQMMRNSITDINYLDGQVLAIASSTDVSMSYDFGLTWQRVLSPVPGYPVGNSDTGRIERLAISGNGKFIIVIQNNATGKVLLSSDYGVNWVVSFDNSIGYWVGCYISETGQYMYTTSRSSSYYSSDYGVTWALSTWSGTSVYGDVVCSYDGQRVVIADYRAETLISTDYGVTYSALPNAPITWDWGVGMSRYGQHILLSSIYSGSSNYPSISSDYGSSWTDITSLATPRTKNATMSATGQYQLLSGDTDIHSPKLSIDYGITWSELYGWVALGSYQYSWGVGISASGQYIMVATSIGTVWLSDDYGVTGYYISTGEPNTLRGVSNKKT